MVTAVLALALRPSSAVPQDPAQDPAQAAPVSVRPPELFQPAPEVGNLAQAAKLAAGVERNAAKSADTAAERDAQLLPQAVTDAQVAWLRELRERAVGRDASPPLGLSQAVSAAFPRSGASKEVDRLSKELRKDGSFDSRLRVALLDRYRAATR